MRTKFYLPWGGNAFYLSRCLALTINERKKRMYFPNDVRTHVRTAVTEPAIEVAVCTIEDEDKEPDLHVHTHVRTNMYDGYVLLQSDRKNAH